MVRKRMSDTVNEIVMRRMVRNIPRTDKILKKPIV